MSEGVDGLLTARALSAPVSILHGAILAEARSGPGSATSPETFGSSASWHARGDGTWASGGVTARTPSVRF
jgi:hypothetical protein